MRTRKFNIEGKTKLKVLKDWITPYNSIKIGDIADSLYWASKLNKPIEIFIADFNDGLLERWFEIYDENKPKPKTPEEMFEIIQGMYEFRIRKSLNLATLKAMTGISQEEQKELSLLNIEIEVLKHVLDKLK